MIMRRALFGASLGAALLVAPNFAFAQAPATAGKDAGTLFDEATALMKDGKYAEACPKFEQSNKLEPGVGVMLWLADCFKRIGKTASSFRQFVAAEQMAAQTKDNRVKVAHQRAAELEPTLSKLVISLAAGAPDGIEVRRDGDLVKNLNESYAIDPGSHIVEATAPGYKHWETKVDVGIDGAVSNISVGPLEREQTASAPAPAAPAQASSGMGPLKVAGLVTAGVGVLGLGVGGVLAVMAKGSLDDSNSNGHCDTADTCDAQGLQLRQDAQSFALMSTIAVIAGGALTVGGLAMFIFAPKPQAEQPAATTTTALSIAPSISPYFSGLTARGTF